MQTPDADQSLQPVRWWKRPSVLLASGFVCLLAVWVGLGLWRERQEVIATRYFDQRSHTNVLHEVNFRRFPRWIPEWLVSLLPEDWRLEVDTLREIGILGSANELDFVMLNRLPDINSATFEDASQIPEDRLDAFIGSHALRQLVFHKPRRLTTRQLELLGERNTTQNLGCLAGPFDESQLRAISRLSNLNSLLLDGPVIPKASAASSLVRLPGFWIFCWTNSDLDDEQFTALIAPKYWGSLCLGKTQLTAKSWPYFEAWPLIELALESPNLSDSAARSIARNHEFQQLTLIGGAISDEGVKSLCSLPHLGFLQLDAGDLTIDCLEHVHRADRLRSLTITRANKVDNSWLAKIAQRDFSSLTLVNSQVTDEGLNRVQGSLHVRRLSLPGSRVTDSAIDALNALGPDMLDLRNTAISDAGLQRLTSDHHLAVHLGGTRVTLEGSREFMARHSEVTVHGVDKLRTRAEPFFFDLTTEPVKIDESRLSAFERTRYLMKLGSTGFGN